MDHRLLSGEDNDSFPNVVPDYGNSKLHLISRAVYNEPLCPAQLSCRCTSPSQTQPERFATMHVYRGSCPSLPRKVENVQIPDWFNLTVVSGVRKRQKLQLLKSSSYGSCEDI